MLIAGAIILVVAFSFVSKLRASSKVKIADTLVRDIEAIAAGAGVAKGGAQSIKIPKANVEFSCSEECSCGIRVGPAERPFKDKFIFAPDNLEDIEMIFYSLGWKVPFRVTNLLYASNKFVQYYIIYKKGDAIASRIVNTLKRKMPKQLKVTYVDAAQASDLDPKNFEEVKFVFVNTEPVGGTVGSYVDMLQKFAKVDINIVKIEPPHSLTFLNKKSKKKMEFAGTVDGAYLAEADMFAAIFSDDSQMYLCNMEKAYRRMGYIADLYAQRAGRLHQAAVDYGLDCPGYEGSQTTLQDLSTIAFQVADNFDSGAVGSLAGAISQLETENKEFLLLGCPLLY